LKDGGIAQSGKKEGRRISPLMDKIALWVSNRKSLVGNK